MKNNYFGFCDDTNHFGMELKRYFGSVTSLSDICDTFDVFANAIVVILILTFYLCSGRRRVWRRNDVSNKHLQLQIPKKYWGHNFRSVFVLILSFCWCLHVGETIIRWIYSQENKLALLILLAPFTSLISVIFSLVYYECLESLAAHPLYLVLPLLLWGLQIISTSARFYEFICIYSVNFYAVAPTLCLINIWFAFCLLIVDFTTVILWGAIDRRKQTVDLNPVRRERPPKKRKRTEIKSKSKSSCFKNHHRPSPAPSSDNSVVLVPSGEIADEEVEEEIDGVPKDEAKSRIKYKHNEASFLSKCTFGWYAKVLKKGWTKPLEFTDLDKIPEEESSKHQYEKFQDNYNKVKGSPSGVVSLWRAFLLSYWRPLASAGILKLFGDTVNVVGPLAISPIVAFVRNIQNGTWELHGEMRKEMYFVGWLEFLKNGWILAFLALVSSILQSTCSQASTHLLATEGIHVKTALQAMIYEKSLKMSVSASKRRAEKESRGKRGTLTGNSQSLDAARVINLTSEDTENIMSFFMHCHYLWAIPFKMCGLVGLLWLQMGNSAVFAAVLAVLLLVPLQFMLAKGIVGANKQIVEACDKRLARTHEVMILIRTVKMLVLETLFLQRVTEARKEELRYLLKDALLRALMTFLTQASGILIILLAFGFYSYLQDKPPDEGIIFSSLALFSQLTVPLFILPLIVAYSIKAKRSTTRLQEFFAEPEIFQTRRSPTPEERVAESKSFPGSDESNRKQIVVVENGKFSYDRVANDVILKNITTSIPRGKLTAILGGVGSGKTSFLLSLLGEVNKISGNLKWEGNGSVAYVSQTPWLLNCTLKENILMGRNFQNRKYKRILGVCALQPDINILPEGDETEIGERGINLSGGQRQRVALARALYSDLPVIMMDCPFSALDATVAHEVFQQVTELHRKKGLSSTIILATQHHRLCSFVDKIIYLEDKTIKYEGTPEEVSQLCPDLWAKWTSSFASVDQSPDDERECSLWKERNSLHRHLTKISRLTRKGTHQNNLGDDDFNENLLRLPLRRHFSFLKSSPLQVLLPSDEMESLSNASISKKRSRAPKASVFRTISSSPTFGRAFDECREDTPFDRRFAKSLPPRPRRARTSVTEEVNRERRLGREDSILKKLFPSPSFRNRGSQLKLTKTRWNSRLWSFLSGKGIRLSEEESESNEDEAVDSGDSNSEVYEILMDEEERERGRISKWNYVAYLRACGWALGGLYMLFLLVNQGLLIALDVWLGHWSKTCMEENCNRIVVTCTEHSLFANYSILVSNTTQSTHREMLQGNESVCEEASHQISSYLLIFGLLSGLAVISGLLTICLAQVAAHRGRSILHERMLKAVVGTKVKFFDLTPIGRILNRFTSDTSLIDKELGWAMMHFMYFALLCSSAILVNAVISPFFILASIPICFIYYCVQHVFRCSSRELKRLDSLSRSPVLGLITETADFPAVIRAYGIQSRFFSCYFRRLDSHLSSSVLLHAGNRWLGISLDYMGSFIVFMSTIACLIGSTTGIGYFLTPLTVGLAIKYTLAIPIYLNWLVRFLSDTEMCLNSVERVQQYTRLPKEADYGIRTKATCCPQKKCRCRDTLTRLTTLKETESENALQNFSKNSEGHLVFENVNLYYDNNNEPVLSQVSFKIPVGQKVGVCGRTGSGKSSLLMGILRMVEHQEGNILINGLDVRKVPLATLRKQISVVPQEVNVFKDTVRFNMDPENKKNDEVLWRVLELVQMKEFVANLPEKLSTGLGNLTLSAGQMQLLVLSRTLLEERRLVLLDEFAANLDPQMERYLLKMLQQELPHSTIISVSHSIVSLMNCDRVLTIDEGKLIEDGSPSQLSQRSHGIFASLLRSANNHFSPSNYSNNAFSPLPS